MVKEISNKDELYNHLCCDTKLDRPSHVQIERGKIVLPDGKIDTTKILLPSLIISDDSISFMNLYNRFKRYGWEVLYENHEVPNIVIEAFDVIETSISEYERNLYKTEEEKNKKAEKDKSQFNSKSGRKKLSGG